MSIVGRMDTRERFHAVMNFQPFDRLPILEWAVWWDETIERWHGEGLPAEVTDRYDICRHFGLDVYKQDWFEVCSPDCPQPASHGAGIIESEADYERLLPHLYPAQPVDVRERPGARPPGEPRAALQVSSRHPEGPGSVQR